MAQKFTCPMCGEELPRQRVMAPGAMELIASVVSIRDIPREELTPTDLVASDFWVVARCDICANKPEAKALGTWYGVYQAIAWAQKWKPLRKPRGPIVAVTKHMESEAVKAARKLLETGRHAAGTIKDGKKVGGRMVGDKDKMAAKVTLLADLWGARVR